MPPKVSDADRRLIAAYTEAALKLKRQLEEIGPRPERRRLLAVIDGLLGQLDELTATYLREDIVAHFKKGSDEAIRQLEKIRGFGEINTEFSQLHKEAIQQIADDASDSFAVALESVRKSSRRFINRAARRAIIGSLIVSEIEGASDPAASVRRVLEDEGIVTVNTGSRKLTLENYASMLSHTILADAHNAGASTRYISNGVEYAQVIERETAPDLTCQTMRGKIVKLGDPRLLPPYHPNCFGGIRPFVGTPSDPIVSIDDRRLPAEVREMLRKNI